MAKVLIIDDEKPTRDFLIELIERIGHQASGAGSRAEGLRLAGAGAFDVIFLDVHLPDGSGLELMPLFRELASKPEIIIMTGLGDPDGAELAVRNGAWDYLQKPLSPKAIILPLRRVLQYRDQLGGQEPRRLLLRREGIIGNGPALAACLDQLAAAAQGQAAVLITGETGTGKELFARCLHENSPRAAGPFVVVDCTNMPEQLMESMLFGHEKGAFTGAERRRAGLIHAADGGTLFLDEIGDLPLGLQKKFLRVLQDKSYRRLGSAAEERSDFRLVAATNRDLAALVERKLFRPDLLYRIQAIPLSLPPLRARLEDLDELTAHILERLYRRDGLAPKRLAADFLEPLRGYDWPGNVRQLQNILESAVARAGEAPELFARHLPDEVRIGSLRSSLARNGRTADPVPGGAAGPPDSSPAGSLTGPPAESSRGPVVTRPEPGRTGARTEALADAWTNARAELPNYKEHRRQALLEIDRAYFERLLQSAGGDLALACALSGLGKSRLYDMLRQCGLRGNFVQ